jgi:hypothetical protein
MIYLMISNTKYFWGGLFAGGFVIGAAATGINWLTTNWVYANLAFRALPPALVGILSLSQMIRMRAMRQSGQVESHNASIYLEGGDIGTSH